MTDQRGGCATSLATPKRRARFTGLAVALFVASACGGGQQKSNGPTSPSHGAKLRGSAKLTAELQRFVDRTVAATPSIPGLLVHVEAPARGLDVTLAAGFADRATHAPLRPNATVRIASNTKTFTAAATLRLVEDARVKLDDPIASHLSTELVEALAAGGYRPDVITTRQLLLHTSGLYDYGRDSGYVATVAKNPNKRWTRLELVRFAIEHGRPRGAPGQIYAYADTGYILLGDIIERTTGTGLAQALRSLLDFTALRLDETYLESAEAPPPGVGARAHQYFGAADGFAVDPSADFYGAAGLVSTVDDLSRFYRALLRGEVFHDPRTLETMLEIPPTNAAENAAMGLFKQEIAGETCWGFSGFWGTFTVTCPKVDATIAASIDQAMPGEDFAGDALRTTLSEVAGIH